MSCYVEACPGSGKTEVAGLKAAYELAGWRHRTCGIAILAFTRNSAKVIRERVAHYAGADAAQYPHFIGTIDSWLHGYLLQPFGHVITGYAGKNGDFSIRLIETDSRAAFLHNYTVTHDGKGIQAHRYYKRHDGTLEGTPRTNITHFDTQLLLEAKDRFLQAGFATYQDAEHICYQVLKQYPTIAHRLRTRFPQIIVDECQDLSHSQLSIFYKLVKAGGVVHLIGDPQQAIYQFRKVNPDDLTGFIKALDLHRKTLSWNFRSNQQIIDACCGLINAPRPIHGTRPTTCTPPCRLWQYTPDTLTTLPDHFAALLADARLEKRKSCILVRGTALLGQLHPKRGSRRSPAALFATALTAWYETHRSTAAIETALHNMGKCLSLLGYAGHGQHQQQYCPEHLHPHGA